MQNGEEGPLAHSLRTLRLVFSMERISPLAPLLLCCLALLLFLMGPSLLDPTRRAVGAATSEAPYHLWGLWSAAEGLLVHGPFVRVADIAFPQGFQGHLMDPVNLLVFAPLLHLLGGGVGAAVLAWNALWFSWFVLGFIGCWLLSRRLLGSSSETPWAAAILSVVFCASPFFLGFSETGRTEYLPATLFPMHLALLHRWMRRPSPLDSDPLPARVPLRVGLGCGLSLAAMWLGGWYLVVFSLILELPLLLYWGWGLRWREALWRAGLVLLIPAIAVLPALQALLQHPPNASMLGVIQLGSPLDVETTPKRSPLELLRMDPLGDIIGIDATVYVGIVALGLSLFGLLRSWRQTLPWLALGLFGLVMAMGPRVAIHVGSEEQRFLMPTWVLLYLAAPLRMIRMWPRMTVLVSLPIGVAAMWGFVSLARLLRGGGSSPRRFLTPLLGFGLCALLFLDQATFPPALGRTRPTFKAAPPAALLLAIERLPPGALVQFPLDVAIFQRREPEEHGHYVLWQLIHRRPVSAAFNEPQDVTVVDSYLSRLIIERQAIGVEQGRARPDQLEKLERELNAQELACARRDVTRMHDLGFAGATLVADLAQGDKLLPPLRKVLGTPCFDEDGVQAWSFADVPASGAEVPRCVAPRLPGKLHHTVPRGRPSGGGPPGQGASR